MSVLCFIPARKNSKRLKNKNRQLLNGRPLICFTIECAIQSGLFDQITVSTDDEEIIEIASKYKGINVHRRSDQLSGDEVTNADVIYNAIDQNEIEEQFKDIVVLYPTVPLRDEGDVKAAWKIYEENNRAVFLTSVTAYSFSPSFALNFNSSTHQLSMHDPIAYNGSTQSQKQTRQFHPNGAIFIFNRDLFYRQKVLYGSPLVGYEMPRERSVDIDYAHQLKLAELLMNEKKK